MAEIIAGNPAIITDGIDYSEIEIQYQEPDPDAFHPVDFITGLVDYLNMLGYGVSQECACQFFAIGGNMTDMDQAECLLKPLIVKNGAQSETFHRDFRQFLKRRHAVVVDAQTERKLQKHMSEQAHLETRLEDCNFTIQAGEREAERLRKEAEKQAQQSNGDPKLEKAYRKVEKSYKSVSARVKDVKLRDRLRKHATGSYKPQSDDEFDQMKDALAEMLKHAISCTDFKNLMAFIKSQASRLKKEQESQRMSAANVLQAKVILFLDISGSCKEVSELMLFFIYTMREVFPGGCKTYVFVNSLYDVSGYMEADNADAAVKTVMNAIPRAGAYSDYYKPFQAFYESHMSEVNNDTLVFFIGDARNNKNESGEEFVKAISRKCKKAYWMNADPYNKWDQGDSIISIYAKYMRMVGEVLTPNQLIEFLMKI